MDPGVVGSGEDLEAFVDPVAESCGKWLCWSVQIPPIWEKARLRSSASETCLLVSAFEFMELTYRTRIARECPKCVACLEVLLFPL